MSGAGSDIGWGNQDLQQMVGGVDIDASAQKDAAQNLVK